MAENLLAKIDLTLAAAAAVYFLSILVLLLVLVARRPSGLIVKFKELLAALEGRMDRLENIFHEDLARSRQESAYSSRQAREEQGTGLTQLTEAILNRMAEIARLQKGQLDSFSKQLADLTALNESKLEALRQKYNLPRAGMI